MERDQQRIQWITDAFRAAGLDAVVCGLPPNVLMLTGYWPIVGQSIGVVTAEGQVGIVAPEDEREFAANAWADELASFHGATRGAYVNFVDVIRDSFAELTKRLNLKGGRIGYESRSAQIPSPYASVHVFNDDICRLLDECLPSAERVDVQGTLMSLAARKTSHEIDRIRIACEIAQKAYETGNKAIKAGMAEVQAANLYRAPLIEGGVGYKGVKRADGFTFCMSGSNGACADSAYQISTIKQIEEGETVLIHCNSYADGYWTDITRTSILGEPDPRAQRAQKAVMAARQEALAALKPGALASDIDGIARKVLTECGYAETAGGSTGHEVGFQAINHIAIPILQPYSDIPLVEGMVFNVEPGIYIPGELGCRHCDMVAVTQGGYELLTPF